VYQDSFFQTRIDSLKRRAVHLSQLKSAVDNTIGLNDRQWSLLDSSLASLSTPILLKLQTLSDRLLPAKNNVQVARKINATLGSIELALSKSYNYFDTYFDILTQRLSPGLGDLLKGCDILAFDAMVKDHPALTSIEKPIVFCDRGFGASIIREGVPFFGLTSNPFPLIQIPYAKLHDKCNLISVLHEAGHQTLVRLGLNIALPATLRENLKRKNAPTSIQELYALWCSEIGPDFWGFCCAGSAQAEGIRDILSLPPAKVFEVRHGDPHPPPYLRVLISLASCNDFFGSGPWDRWREEWKAMYPLETLDSNARELYQACIKYIPVVLSTLRKQKWTYLQDRTIPGLFDMNQVSPANLTIIAGKIKGNTLDFRHAKPCTQLAAFRNIQSQRIFDNETLDNIMTQWLKALGKRNQ
jgi:hypothetical protein